MPAVSSRHPDTPSVAYTPARSSGRAVFLVETRNRQELVRIDNLIEIFRHLAEVIPIARGAIVAFAVQVEDDTSLFGKIEWLLKTQFAFTLLERNFSDVTLRLVRSLCAETNSQLLDVPRCAICQAPDPFPARVTTFSERPGGTEQAFCARCATKHHHEDPLRTALALLELVRPLAALATEPSRTPRDEHGQADAWEAGAVAMAG